MRESVDAVLFDFDGTLAPNLDLPHMRREVARLTQARGVPAKVTDGLYIVEMIDVAQAWLHQHQPDQAPVYAEQAHQIILDIELAAAAQTEPFASTRRTLTELRTRGLGLGVVTRNCRAAVFSVFPDLDLFVDAVFTRDDVTHLKPDPRHLQAALDTLDCEPQRAAMVGDGQLDMRSGRELDMYCVGVLTGSSDRARLEQAGAHTVLTHCDQLCQPNVLRNPT